MHNFLFSSCLRLYLKIISMISTSANFNFSLLSLPRTSLLFNHSFPTITSPIEPLPASTLIPSSVSTPLTPHYLVQPRCERSSPSIGNSSPYSSPRSDRSSQFINSFNHYAQHYQQPLTHPLPPVPAMASTHPQESEQYADQLKFIEFVENLLERRVIYCS